MLRNLFLLLAFSISIFTQAKTMNTSDVTWFASAKKAGITNFNVCGSANISLNKKALNKYFTFGPKKIGYLFTNLSTKEEYDKILRDFNLNDAKSNLYEMLKKTNLWTYSKKEGFKNLGLPSKIEYPFTATVKDCMEGAKTTAGNDCSKNEGDQKMACCREKFAGPIVYWGKNQAYKLNYSPDPSVSMKVPGEKSSRFCNIRETIEL